MVAHTEVADFRDRAFRTEWVSLNYHKFDADSSIKYSQ